MNKELTPLEAWEKFKNTDVRKPFEVQIYTDIIETALKNYEEGIKNSKSYKHRKGKEALFDLECLALKNTDKRYWKLPEQLADDVRNEMKALLKKNIELEAENLELKMNIDIGAILMENLNEKNKKYETELKALEIIKEKRVNVRCLMSGWKLGNYNSYKAHEKLTQEEYDLLKEELE